MQARLRPNRNCGCGLPEGEVFFVICKDADMFKRICEGAIDVLFDVTEPVAGKCSVCAFWRGLVGGAVVTAIIFWMV